MSSGCALSPREKVCRFLQGYLNEKRDIPRGGLDAVVLARYILRVSSSSYPITPAVIEQRREAATVHGARSEVRIRAVAKSKKRLVMARLGMRLGELSAVEAVLVDVLARFLAKAELIDRYFEGRGILEADGEPKGALASYFAALNGARLTAKQLGEQLDKRRDGSEETLEAYIEANYARSNGDGAHE